VRFALSPSLSRDHVLSLCEATDASDSETDSIHRGRSSRYIPFDALFPHRPQHPNLLLDHESLSRSFVSFLFVSMARILFFLE
jgi:hypothetical protein